MSSLVLKEVTLESSAQPGHFLEEIVHLILELNVDGRVADKVNLLSREATTGIWDGDEILILRELEREFTLSVFLEFGGEERQLLGYMELYGPSLLDRLGERSEIPLIGNEDLVLKTMVEAASFRSGVLDQIRDFERTGNLDSLEQAISELQLEARRVPADDPNRIVILNNLGACLFYRFESLGQIDDLENSIAQQQTAIHLTPGGHPDKASQLNNLGNLLRARFMRLGNTNDIDGAIKQQKVAITLCPDTHPGRPSYLSSLGNSLLSRFKYFGNVDDLEDAILQHQAAVNMTSDGHPLRPSLLCNLGTSLTSRFECFGNVADLDNAILQEQAAASLTPDDHPDKPNRLNNLGNSFQTRFKCLGVVGDIDSAIEHLQAAIKLKPDHHPEKPDLLNNLGNSLLIRFERLGNIDDVDAAIAQHRRAVHLTPNGHPDKPNKMDNLGNSLQTRFKRFGNGDDINSAISLQLEAVDLTADSHLDKPRYLSNLGNSLMIRFERFGSRGDIDNAIVHQRAAVVLTPPDHSNKPTRLNNLGNSLLTRFNRFGNIDYIDDAIKQQQLAIDLTPDGHPNKPSMLSNLGGSLSTRYEQFGNINDNDQAIAQQLLAVDMTPPGHPEKARHLHNLACSFLAHFLRLHHLHDAEAAIAHFSAAAQLPIGSPSQRLGSAQHWIRVASMIDHHSLLAAYECALAVVPLVAWLGLSIKDRHQHLVQMGAIARDAAAAAISLEHYDKAVEWLEQGRSIVWTQILQLRTPVDRLRDVNPNLANDLLRVSRLLDSGTEQRDPRSVVGSSREEEGRRHRALAEEWGAIIERIRELPDFQDFLRPPRLSRLLRAAQNGPVIVLNIAKERCDALALIDGVDEVIHIPLPGLTLEKATELQADLTALLKWSGIRMRAIREPEYEEGGNGECKRILGELWDCLVKPVLDSLAFSSCPDTLPRIWWCVTGPLAFLPIHAAGKYDESPDEQLHNYVISSYTPTLTALLESPKVTANTPFKMLSVIEPSTGRYYIPNTKVELEHIQRRLKNRDHLVLEGPDATKERVMKAMKDCQWIHLACHGSQNARSPTKSALMLRGGDLFLEQIIKLDLPQAEFAFLSACQTVTGDQTLSDEAVHIAGGMLLAGYRSVVATMWSIEDKLAPEVADEFYGHLIEDGVRPDSRKTAEALHVSVQKLRKKRGIPMVSWLPFVHIGV